MLARGDEGLVQDATCGMSGRTRVFTMPSPSPGAVCGPSVEEMWRRGPARSTPVFLGEMCWGIDQQKTPTSPCNR